MASWLADEDEQLTIGTDFRFVNQELNEITARAGFFPLIDGWPPSNSPLPDSNWVNPGLFAQYTTADFDGWQTTFGLRTDVVSTRIVDDPAKLASVGTLPAGSGHRRYGRSRPHVRLVGSLCEFAHRRRRWLEFDLRGWACREGTLAHGTLRRPIIYVSAAKRTEYRDR